MEVIRNKDNIPVCSTCGKELIQKDFELKGHTFKVWILQCECRDKQDNMELIKEARFHKEYLEIIFNNHKTIQFDENKLLSSVKAYYKNLNKRLDLKIGLFLIGGTGIGKTLSLVWLLIKIIESNGLKVKYTTQENLISLFFTLSKNKQEYNQYKRCPILFIDDINKKQWDMYDIVDYRVHNKLITFYASNLEEEMEIKEILGEAVLSRIKYKTIFDIIDDMPDKRILKYQEVLNGKK